ncbi:MAG: hypothetical protein IPN29_05370 [Saprospiraceae bacterium]|nr:hypothetical protein [Saprospiraceae bacterium]
MDTSWTLALRKDIFSLLFQHKYIWYLVLSFVLNFIVYWVSPEVYPRYILMLIPLIFSVWIYLYGFEIGKNNLNMTVISWLFKFMVIAVPLLILSQYNNPRLAYVDDYVLKMIALVVALSLCAVVYFKDQPNRHILFVIYLLVVRLGFDVLVLPVRAMTGDDEYYKREAVRIGRKYTDVKLYEDTQLNHITTFYITNETQKITNRSNQLTDAAYFIVDSCYMDRFALIDSFPDASFCGTRWVIKGEK